MFLCVCLPVCPSSGKGVALYSHMCFLLGGEVVGSGDGIFAESIFAFER